MKEVVDTALGIAGEGFDMFGDEKTKRVGKFATDAACKGLKAVDKGDVKEVVDTALGITGEGFDTFGDATTKRVGKFVSDKPVNGLKRVQIFDFDVLWDGFREFNKANNKSYKYTNGSVKRLVERFDALSEFEKDRSDIQCKAHMFNRTLRAEMCDFNHQ